MISPIVPCKKSSCEHTTLSGTPGGGRVRFFGGGPLR